jgi:hypothetical protein
MKRNIYEGNSNIIKNICNNSNETLILIEDVMDGFVNYYIRN